VNALLDVEALRYRLEDEAESLCSDVEGLVRLINAYRSAVETAITYLKQDDRHRDIAMTIRALEEPLAHHNEIISPEEGV